jgi:hypothetical protein
MIDAATKPGFNLLLVIFPSASQPLGKPFFPSFKHDAVVNAIIQRELVAQRLPVCFA